MLHLLCEFGEVVFEYPLYTTESGGHVVGLLAGLKSLASLWDLPCNAVLTGSLAVALLLAAIAFRAGKVDAVAFPRAASVGFWVLGRRIVVVSLGGVGGRRGGGFAVTRLGVLDVRAASLHWNQSAGCTI